MAYLEQHAPRPKDDDDDSGPLTPSEEEQKLCKQIEKLFEKHVKHRKKYDKDWIDNYKMFRGYQWLQKRPSYKHREVINLIFQTIQSQSSVMMDTRPTVAFLPQDPTDQELSEILNQVFEADWERNNWMDELYQIILDGHISSVGYGKACYEENAHDELGGIQWSCEDYLDFYPDPEATDVNKKGEAFIVAKPESIDVIKKRYAGHKYVDLIKPDLEDLNYFKRSSETLHQRRNTDLDINKSSQRYSGSNEDADGKDQVLVVTAYLKPSETEQIEKEDDDSEGEKLYITRLKYPRGRKVVKIGNYIFEDGELEYEHMKYPYQRYVNYNLPREFFGMSEIDQTKGPQLIFNKLINFSLDVLTLMGNPIWSVPIEGNVKVEKLTNQPGLIVEYANGEAPQRQEGVTLQPYVLQLIDRMEKWFNDTAGTQDVTRGINPTGVTANAAIENLLDAASKRIKQKMRNVDCLLREFGKQWVSLCFQYYTAPQIFRLTGKDSVQNYFKFNVEKRETGEMDMDGKPKTKNVAIIRQYRQDENTKQYMPDEQVKEYEVRGSFDVRVNTISGLPFTKIQNEQQVLNLFDRQIIDAQEVLDRLDYPNKEAILQRMAEQAQAQAQAEQQQAQ